MTLAMEQLSPKNVSSSPRPTVLHQSAPHSPVGSPTGASQGNPSQHDLDLHGTEAHQPSNASPSDSHMSDQPGQKRKRPTTSKLVSKEDRKKVSRACDTCKARKVRCSGTQPCSRCVKNNILRCEYNAEHKRGRPPSPELVAPVEGMANEEDRAPTFPANDSRLHQGIVLNTPISVPSTESLPAIEQRKSSRSSQEPDETRFEGHYIGPTSGIAFLHRAQRRFKQDFVNTNSTHANSKGTAQPSVFSFGDGHFPDPPSSDLVFPSRPEARHLLDRYFEFAMPTYRFLHRTTVEGWLDNICDENENGIQMGQSLSNAKISIVLLILATSTLYGEDLDGLAEVGGQEDNEKSAKFFIASERRLANETGPVRLESVQARLAQCIYLLGSSRINQAWYTFGTTCQMILALGLHRRRYSQSFGASSEVVEVESRRRVFWSAYTLDRYLSVILGRPRMFRDEDIDQLLPDSVNDSDLTCSRKPKSVSAQCVSDGPVFHAKLAKIIGGISSDLYPTNKSLEANWTECAERRTAELKDWKESLPAFLEPEKVDPSMLIPIFQRQSTVLRLAYAHALILANRQSLLSNFADLSRPESLPPGELQGSIKECIDAAMLVVDTVNEFIEQGKMRKAFWFTHYISFCAIATLYVYTIQKNLRRESANAEAANAQSGPNFQHFEAADRCQKNIIETTVSSSPFRRYNIILDELKKEVVVRLGKVNQSNVVLAGPGEYGSAAGRPGFLMDSSGGTPNRTPTRVGELPQDFTSNQSFIGQEIQNFPHQTYLQDDPSANLGLSSGIHDPIFDESMLDPGLFGLQDDLVGWSEFDACALNWPEGFDWAL